MQIIEILKKAKAKYEQEISKDNFCGMCWCIKTSIDNFSPIKIIQANIPEFNPKFLGANISQIKDF